MQTRIRSRGDVIIGRIHFQITIAVRSVLTLEHDESRKDRRKNGPPRRRWIYRVTVDGHEITSGGGEGGLVSVYSRRISMGKPRDAGTLVFAMDTRRADELRLTYHPPSPPDNRRRRRLPGNGEDFEIQSAIKRESRR